MATLNGLPVFKIKIDQSLESNEGIDFISLVDFPAIEKNWVAMSEKPAQKMAFNKAKQILYGPILIPGFHIYRNDPKIGEYYCVFEKDEIELIVRKFQAQQKTLNINYQHKKDSQVKNATVQEIWLSGVKDKSQDFGFELPVGTAFAGTHIADSKFWLSEVETQNVRGYSIEGWLDMIMQKTILNKNKFMEAKTKDGTYTIKTPAEAFAVNVDVVTVDAEGKETPAADGDYELENGTILKVVASKITEIVEASGDEELSTEEVAAMSKLFSKVIESATKPLMDKITALETKLANTPGAASATATTDKGEEKAKPTPAQIALAKVRRLKEINQN